MCCGLVRGEAEVPVAEGVAAGWGGRGSEEGAKGEQGKAARRRQMCRWRGIGGVGFSVWGAEVMRGCRGSVGRDQWHTVGRGWGR